MLKNLRLLTVISLLLVFAPSCAGPEKTGQPSPGRQALDLVRQGQMAMLDDNFGAARVAFARACILDPECAEAAYHLGRLEEKAGNPKGALDAYESIGRLSRENKLYVPARNHFNRLQATIVAEKIVEAVRQLGDRSVAVLDFTDKDRRPNYLGTLFGEELSTAIARLKEPGVTIVERRNLKELLAEKMLDQTDLVDKNRAKDVKGFISVDILVTGMVLEKTFVKAIIKDMAKPILQEDFPTFGGGESRPVSKPWQQLTMIRNHKPGFKIKLWTDKPPDKPHLEKETITFYFTAEKDCYVYLYVFNPDGSMAQLFPNEYIQQAKVKAGTVYTFPPKNPEDQLFIDVKPPFGLHRVKMIACTRNMNPLNMQPGEVKMKEIPKDDDTTMRNLSLRLRSEPQTEWAETLIRVATQPENSSR